MYVTHRRGRYTLASDCHKVGGIGTIEGATLTKSNRQVFWQAVEAEDVDLRSDSDDLVHEFWRQQTVPAKVSDVPDSTRLRRLIDSHECIHIVVCLQSWRTKYGESYPFEQIDRRLCPIFDLV